MLRGMGDAMVISKRTHEKAAHAGGAGMLQALYEAARKEVFADPAAALRKYEPSWAPSLTVAPCAKDSTRRPR